MQTTTYKLNVTPGGVPLTIHISQYDVGLRQYTFQPYTTVGEFSYVSGATVTLEATKPDGYAVIHECDYNQDGSITYTVQAQLAAKPGRVWSKVVIRDGSDVLGTGAVVWIVDNAGVKDNAIISDSDISALQQWMDDVEDYAEQADGSAQAAASSASLAESAVTSAQAAATQAAGYVDQAVILGGTPLVAATVSAMSDHDRVYVYTGSETGYTAGNWYYWNGSAWTSGGIYNSSAVQTDPTLSVSGMAADAAATGELKTDLGDINGSWINTTQVDYDKLTISEGKKISGYDTTTYLPVLANGEGSVVVDFSTTAFSQYEKIKFPRCSISTQWIILYSATGANNYTKSSTTVGIILDLSNQNYGVIDCTRLADSNFTRVAIALDGRVDITADTGFDTFHDLMLSVNRVKNANTDVRNIYYKSTIDISVQTANANVSFDIFKGETLRFTNNTSGTTALYAMETDDTLVNISTGLASGKSIDFTADHDFHRIRYWSQQLGTITVERVNTVVYELQDNIDTSAIASVNMFSSIAAIGDSYTSGSTKSSGGTWLDYRNLSWIATMGKRSGTEWKNYGHGGTTTKTYLETTEFSTALSDTACDIYFFAFGQNDGNVGMTIGTVSDIHDADYTQNPDTFYGNYGRIIQQVKNHAPNAKLVVIKNWVQGATWTDYDTAIEGIATHYSIPVISPFDDYYFSSELYANYKNDGHPTAMGYSSMGIAMERLFSKCVVDNPSYFKFATIG